MRARDIIYSSVDSRLARYLRWNHDIFQWMRALTDAVLAEQSEQVAQLAAEYQGIIWTFKATMRLIFEAWLLKWEDFLQRAAWHQVMEAIGSPWLLDIAYLMSRYNIGFSERCRKAAKALSTSQLDYRVLFEGLYQQL